MQTFEHLLSPIKIRKLELANRVVMPPMGTSLGNDDGTVSEALLAYISRQAKSGAGPVISEITAVHPCGVVGPGHLLAYTDEFIPGLAKYADAVHAAAERVAAMDAEIRALYEEV